MIKNLNIFFLVATSVCILGLLFSSFTFDAYVKSHPEIRQQLQNTNGEPRLISEVCEKIDLPLIAQSMSFFVPATLFSLIAMALVWVISFRKTVSLKVRTVTGVVFLLSAMIFFAVQVWEPDFAYVLCGLV